MSPIPDEQAGPKPPPPPKPGDIQEKYRQQVYDNANRALRGEISADEWEEEIRRLEKMK